MQVPANQQFHFSTELWHVLLWKMEKKYKIFAIYYNRISIQMIKERKLSLDTACQVADKAFYYLPALLLNEYL